MTYVPVLDAVEQTKVLFFYAPVFIIPVFAWFMLKVVK